MEQNFYEEEYMEKNKSFHLEDTFFKVENIIILIDEYLLREKKKIINIMDIGGGTGVILSILKTYYLAKGIKLNCYSNDLSKNILSLVKKNFKESRLVYGDIREVKFNKKFDICLLIDVIEHINNPEDYINRLSKITEYAIFKTPLENSFLLNLKNKLTNNSFRKHMISKVGHINSFNINQLHKILTINNEHKLIKQFYSNTFKYELSSPNYKKRINLKRKFYLFLGEIFYLISPKISASLFCDFSYDLIKYERLK